MYLRLPDGVNAADIPADTLEDCVQLVKQNSIQGGLLRLAWRCAGDLMFDATPGVRASGPATQD